MGGVPMHDMVTHRRCGSRRACLGSPQLPACLGATDISEKWPFSMLTSLQSFQESEVMTVQVPELVALTEPQLLVDRKARHAAIADSTDCEATARIVE